MVVIQAEGVSKSYGINTVIAGASFRIKAGDKVGLVGRNGAGKTTLLRLLAGVEAPDSGRIVISEGVRLGLVEQDPSFDSSAPLIDVVYSGVQELLDMEKDIARLSREMSAPQVAASPDRLKRVMRDFAALTEEFERRDGYSMDSRVAGVLAGLGFSREEHLRPVGSFSGGERTRVALARALLARPDVLLLDEPTNHLDIPSTAWLEDFLADYDGTVIVISHDRQFLDCVVTRILEVEDHRVVEYAGNYSSYVEEKQRRLTQQETAYELQQKEIARLEGMLRRYTALSARNNKFARRAEDIRKKLARIERVERPVLKRKSMGFSLSSAGHSGEQVLRAKGLAMRFGDRVLFEDADIVVRRGEHVGIVGRNGVGKSTLLHIITGRTEPSAGTVRLGAGVVIGYYDQQHADLAPDRTVLEEVLGSTSMTPQEARNLLGRFLFKGDDVFKRVRDLSGGERNRVELARIMASGCNLLVMDEPTNHLDIDSIEVLERALAGYEGTLLVVSHDRYFLERVADRIIEVENGRIVDYPGGYAYYVEKKLARQTGGDYGSGLQGGKDGANVPAARRACRVSRPSQVRGGRVNEEGACDIDTLEKQIMELEATIKQLNAELADLEIYLYPDRMAEKAKSLADAEKRLAECYKKWEDLAHFPQ
ncbi:MAG: ABC-F family ATP-binding cassette domain-containing protein [Bacillota bacterium]|nr:ABC-F family ATP-binding cassette domain-containing protein [Bacillota bacterium]